MDNNYTKTAIITGAGAGIGRATALALLNAGYAVALAGRNIAAILQSSQNTINHFTTLLITIDLTRLVLSLILAIRLQF